MRPLIAFTVAGIAALALAGTSALAASAQTNLHEMTIRLPGGGVEHIEYSGNVAPQVTVGPAPAFAVAWPAPMAFWSDPAFADLQRISADMNRQMDALFRQTQAFAAAPWTNPQGLYDISLGKLPAGSHFCSQSVQITMPAQGKPQVVSHQSGDCAAFGATAGGETSAAPDDSKAIQIKAHMAAPQTVRTTL